MRVPKPSADYLLLEILKETNGIAIAVTDDEIKDARIDIAVNEGLNVCPEGAAALAGAENYARQDGLKSMRLS